MNVTDIEVGDYCLCDLEYEDPVWVRVDQIHTDLETECGYSIEENDRIERGEMPYTLMRGGGFSGEVVSQYMIGVGYMPTFDEEVTMPMHLVRKVFRKLV